MNRTGLGLAVGAGYVLGRTKKMKLAFALGTLAAGKRMHLSPQGIMDLVSGQLRNNPQFKEIGDQLREELRGMGKAASGAMVERQLDAFADRLHGRTTEMREQLSGAVPTSGSRAEGAEAEGAEEEGDEDRAEEPDEPGDAEQDSEQAGEPEESDESDRGTPPAGKAPKKATRKSTARRSAPKKKTPEKRTGGARSAARRKTAAGRSKGGEES